jgi:hypothetical protein
MSDARDRIGAPFEEREDLIVDRVKAETEVVEVHEAWVEAHCVARELRGKGRQV